MADILNLGVCGADGSLATGKPFCDIIKGRMKGILFADPGVFFDASERASITAFNAAVAEKTRAARGSRIYPIWNLNNFEDNTPDPTSASTGNLTTKQIITDSPIPQFSFAHSGGELLHKKLVQLEVGQYEVFLVDANNVVYGRTNSDGNFQGFTVYQNYVYPSKFIGGDAVNQYRFTMQLDSFNEYRDLASFVVSNSALGATTGINNVQLAVVNHTTNVVDVSFIADGGKDLTTIYATELVVTANTLVTKDSDGTSFTVTSRAVVAGTPGVVRFTLDSTAYTALASGAKININLAAPAVLSANGIDGFESLGRVQIEKA